MARTKKVQGKSGSGRRQLRNDVAGIDIGASTHWVCGPAQKKRGERPVESFPTTTAGLKALVRWLKSLGVKSAAMESTSVYWIPLYELLEESGIEAVLVDSRVLKQAPARKSDVSDCEWIQELHAAGLYRGAFRPAGEICQLRALHRHRGNLVRTRATAVQWMQKSLDQMNVQVHRAVSDLTGVTGMKIVRAIVAGERDPETLSQFRDHRCRKTPEKIAEHLTGTWRAEHLMTLRSSLKIYDDLTNEIAELDKEMMRVLVELTPEERVNEEVPEHPNAGKRRTLKRRGELETREHLARFAGVDLTLIDGISAETARIILTEIGPDISAFENHKKFVAWLQLAPHKRVSGGKVLKGRPRNMSATRVGNAFRTAAVALQRTDTALGAYFRRIAARKAAPVAVGAVARKLAIIVYKMLKFGAEYTDIGAEEYEAINHQRKIDNLKRNASKLGLLLVEAPQN